MNSRVIYAAEHTSHWNSRKGAAPQKLGLRWTGHTILKDGWDKDGKKKEKKAFELGVAT